jgi:hypothetical protein
MSKVLTVGVNTLLNSCLSGLFLHAAVRNSRSEQSAFTFSARQILRCLGQLSRGVHLSAARAALRSRLARAGSRAFAPGTLRLQIRIPADHRAELRSAILRMAVFAV